MYVCMYNRIASGSGKYIGFGLNGTERTTIVDMLRRAQPAKTLFALRRACGTSYAPSFFLGRE